MSVPNTRRMKRRPTHPGEMLHDTRHGKPAGVLIGFESEDAWFEYRLENHPEFLRRVSEARAAIQDGRGVRLEAV